MSSQFSSGRVEYFSATDARWIASQIVAKDLSGSVQIDKYPGVWITPEEQKSKLRPITQPSSHGAPAPSSPPAAQGTSKSPATAMPAQGIRTVDIRTRPSQDRSPHAAVTSTASLTTAHHYRSGSGAGTVTSAVAGGSPSAANKSNADSQSGFPPMMVTSETPRQRVLPHCNPVDSSCSQERHPFMRFGPPPAAIPGAAELLSSKAAPNPVPQPRSAGVWSGAEVSNENTTPKVDAGNGAASAEAAASELPNGEPVAYDEWGRLSIVRQINPETGAARTIVKNDDGTHRIFGEHTVASLTGSLKDEASKWVKKLSCRQLHGLTHEVGQRLLEGSSLYHGRLSQLEEIACHLNYAYFGLTADASEKELDLAYRKLAKQMHPDKNGGTEEAKKRFQFMKDRYEALKKRLREEDDSEDEELEHGGYLLDGTAPETGNEGTRGKKKKKKQDSDEEEKTDEKAGRIEYDPDNFDSMIKCVLKMTTQLKNIEIQMQELMKELERHKATD